MKKILGALIMLTALTLSSCSKEDSSAGGGRSDGKGTKLVALSAGFSPSSKAAVTSSGVVTWTLNDQIGVYTTSGKIRAFDISSGAGSASATFVATLPSGENPSSLAVYPYASFKSLSGTSATVNYPATYSYSSGAMNAPMAAIPSDGSLSFMHLGGMIRVNCNPVPDEAVAFHLVAKDKQIVGNFLATVSDDMAVTTSAASTNTKCKVTFDAASGDSKTFNIPIPAGEYPSIYAYFTDASGNKIREWQVLTDVTVVKGDMFVRSMPALLRVISYNWLLNSGTTDEKHTWAEERKANMIAALPYRYYDIMGSQESTTQQISDVQAAVGGYEVFGVSNQGYALSSLGSTSDYSTCALWRKSDITLTESGTFWYSSTPNIASRRNNEYHYSACNWAKLRYNGKTFYHFNVHLEVNGDGKPTGYDSKYTEMRLYQWSILKPYIEAVSEDYPVVLTGDFNNTVDDADDVIQTIIADGTLRDAYSLCPQPHGPAGTLNYFRTTTATRRIDFVFVNDKFKVESYRVDSSQQTAPSWESDHNPLIVDLSFVE